MAEVVFQGIRKKFGNVEALKGVDLEIAQGQFAVILGPSGCGKSTLLRILAGLERVSAGAVHLGGQDVTQTNVGARDVAMVFQNYALYPHLTVAQNLGYSLKVAGVARAEREARITRVAELLQIDGYLDRRPGQLSGGQRQRVAMGRAIIREPRAFLFDEPLSNLDAKLRVQMRLEIKRLHRRQGVTSLFVTHDQVEAMTLADTLVVMNAGQVEQVGPPAKLYRHPATAFVAGFLGNPAMSLLSAVAGEDRRSLRLDGGEVLPLSGRVAAEPGTLVQVGIRPEHLRIGPGSGIGSGIWANVEFVEELGNGRLVHMDLGGPSVTALVPVDDERGFAGQVRVALAPEHLRIFAAETGRAIAQEGLRTDSELEGAAT